MDKREIRITIFYSDLYVFDWSRHKSQLERIIKSANDFFGKYKLRIDPFPFPYDYTAYKNAFVLAARDGVKPDMGGDLASKIFKEDEAHRFKLIDEMADPATSPERRAEIKKELKWLADHKTPEIEWRLFNRTGEHDFRTLIGERSRTSKILKRYEKTWKKAPRLAVVLCEFIWLERRSLLNRDVVGVFIPTLKSPAVKEYRRRGKPIPSFREPFVIVDIQYLDWHLLAHEIVHGNGHVHSEESDGVDESIMNDNSQGLNPSRVILEEADLKSLEQAFFVRERK